MWVEQYVGCSVWEAVCGIWGSIVCGAVCGHGTLGSSVCGLPQWCRLQSWDSNPQLSEVAPWLKR